MLITAYSDVSGMAPLLRFYKQYEQKYKKNSVKITRIFVSVERIALYFSLIIRFEEARNSKAWVPLLCDMSLYYAWKKYTFL